MKLLSSYLFLLNCFSFFTAASSSSHSTTEEISLTSRNSSIESLVTLNNPDLDRIFVCDEIFKRHFADFYLRTDSNNANRVDFEIIYKAIQFAAKVSNSFVEVISDENVSIPVHCFLLEYFLKVARFDHQSIYFYSKFIRIYSEAISSKVGRSITENDRIVNVFIFPLIKELVSTGNFLHYSILLSTCINHLNFEQKNELYTIHFSQYLNRQQNESEIDIETFAFGIEFLNLYIPRYELLSIMSEEQRRLAMAKPFVYYLFAFNPLKAVVLSYNASVVAENFNPVLTADNEFTVLPHLETFLIKTNFLNITTIEQYVARKSIFNALIKIDNVLLLVNCGFLTCFQAWLRFQYAQIDEWTLATLKAAAYGSDDHRFKVIFDSFFR